MTTRFRSAFFGSSGFVAVRPQARVVEERSAADRDPRVAARSHAEAAPQPAKAA